MAWLQRLVHGYIIKKGMAKAVKAAVAALIGLVTGAKVQPVLSQLGVSVDPKQLEVGLTVLMTGGVTLLLNWLKVRFGVKYL